MTPRQMQKLLAPVRRRLLTLATRGLVRLIDSDEARQLLQVGLYDGTLDGVEHFEAYGLTTHPPKGAEAILLALGGSRDHTVALAVGDRRVRLKGLAQGEVALYDDEGTVIVLRRGKRVEIRAERVEVVADEVHLGDEDAADAVALAGDVKNELTRLQTHFQALETILTGPPIPEAGMGAPSALQAALGIAISAAPYPSPGEVAAKKVKAS